MNVFVCIKQVPARDSILRVSPDERWVEETDLSYEMNEPDSFALEEGLRLKEQHGGEVIAVAAGPPRTAAVIREALAKGADRGILIEDDSLGRAGSLATARALAAALKDEDVDLILTGLQSDDTGFGQTGVILAELLGFPHASIVIEVAVRDGILHARRELEAGWFQGFELPLPALLTIQSGINKVRYATLMGIKKAKTKSLRRHTLPELGVAAEEGLELRRLYPPRKSKQTQLLEGPDAAAQLVEKLKFEARVL
jgi:electron transfer flavoprotein beta subunit